MKKIKIYLLALLSMFILACDPSEPNPNNEEELITTLSFALTPQGGGSKVVLKFEDKDGDGGSAPNITSGSLDKNKIYDGVIELLNESVTPSENISNQVITEAEDHQFFYAWTQALSKSIFLSYTDVDKNNNPLGIKTKLETKDAGNGQIKITLRHLPNKTGQDVKNGIITNAGGETDIEVTFNLEVK